MILLALDSIGKGRVVRNLAHVKVDDLARLALPEMINRGFQAFFDQFFGNPKLIQHLQSRWMKGGGAQIQRAIATGFQQDNVYAFTR